MWYIRDFGICKPVDKVTVSCMYVGINMILAQWHMTKVVNTKNLNEKVHMATLIINRCTCAQYIKNCFLIYITHCDDEG